MKRIENYTIGADFELFLKNKETDEIINAKNYVKGSKKRPFNFDKTSPFWCTSLDNISLEGNIKPCTNANEFDQYIKYVIDYMNSKLPKNLCTVHDPAVFVNPEQLYTRESKMFGCEATYNAYTLEKNPMLSAEETNLRTCCTHVHIKYDDMDIITSSELVKAMDLFLGVPSVMIEPPNMRRTLYGKLGEMRFNPKKTTEYRVLSSFFSETEQLRKWVFENTVKAIDWINEGNLITADLFGRFNNIMSNTDIDDAEQLVKEYNIPIPL